MTSAQGTPKSEHEIDADLVRRLLRAQHPDLAGLPISSLDSGWDNAMFRLGDEFLVRLPRREVSAKLIENEQTWLPRLAKRLPLAIPAPVRTGEPGLGYPWGWSVLPWMEGVTADQEVPMKKEATRFAEFLRALHRPAPDDAPINLVRGVPLAHRAEATEERMRRLEEKGDFITPEVRRLWETAMNAPLDGDDRWLHGDLHPRNVLVAEGRITGIIDWGDITSGDIATDLASIWMLFADPEARRQALTHYGELTEATLDRAKGWAILFGVVLLDTGLVDNPPHAAIGEKTLKRVVEE